MLEGLTPAARSELKTVSHAVAFVGGAAKVALSFRSRLRTIHMQVGDG